MNEWERLTKGFKWEQTLAILEDSLNHRIKYHNENAVTNPKILINNEFNYILEDSVMIESLMLDLPIADQPEMTLLYNKGINLMERMKKKSCAIFGVYIFPSFLFHLVS